MRDILLTAIVACALPFILKFPEIGAYMWAWMGLMNPHKMTFGFAREVPFAYIIAIATLIGLVFSKSRKPFPVNAITVLILALMAWMTVTSIFALNPGSIVWDRWIFVMKIHLMLLVTMMLLRGRKQIETLIWIVTASVVLFGVKGGIWTILVGGAGRVWGPPGGMLEGNNELAVALVVLMPMMYYLYQTSARRWVRIGLVLSLIFTAFAVLGTQSRGALLALVAMTFVLGLKGQKPWRTSIGLAILVGGAIVFMPDSWTERMDTILEYTGDASAMSRIHTWQTLWNVAADRPFVGAGFGADNPALFAKYSPEGVLGGIFEGRVYVAHSIYFQALGEHGFVGFILYISLGLATWFMAARLTRTTRTDPEYANWVPMLMRMVQVGLAGFAVGGAFLSLMHLDLIYYLLGLVALTDVTIRERAREKLAKPNAAPATPVVRPNTHPRGLA